MNWTAEHIRSQKGKVFLVTGANTGLGFETSLELAKKDGHVILAGRNEQRIDAAIEKILQVYPSASIEAGVVDLADLQSVRAFAETVKARQNRLDALINNAGIMFPPPGKTKDGFESQFGVNYVAHFLLTYELMELLQNTSNSSRIVTLSSIAHRNGAIDFNNLKLEKPFEKFREYGQSKVADLIFALELQRRLERNGLNSISVAAHPGISKTELLRTDKPEMINTVPHMSANQGALSTLFAATEPLQGGEYIGPDGDGEMTGYPGLASVVEYAQGEEIAERLWTYTERELNIQFL